MACEVYGNDSGYLKSFRTIQEAKEFIKDLKRFDKENSIADKYYIVVSIPC